MAGNTDFGFGTPFAGQLAFFRQKLNLPSERWDDIAKSAHDKAFIVAGAGKADLLDDLRRAMDKAQAHGAGLGEFRKDFAQITFNCGWTGFTGDGSKAGIAWRTKVIYQTNMATSYAAGRWQQLNHPDLLKLRPYWRYHHADGVLHPRPQHRAWNGLTLPHDHPFWKLHYPPQIPPNWGCHCYVTAVDAAGYTKAQAAGKGAPPAGWVGVDAKYRDPALVAQGWNFAPGANVNRPLKDFIDAKLIKLDAPIGAAMAEVLRPVLLKETAQAFSALVEKTLLEPKPPGTLMVVGALKPLWVEKAATLNVRPATADISVHDPDIWHTFRSGKDNQVGLEWYKLLPYHLLDAKAVILDTTHDTPAFLLIYDGADKSTKLVVQINYKIKKVGLRNIVETGKLVDVTGIRAMIGRGYEYIEGGL